MERERTETHKITITLKFELLLCDDVYCNICGNPILRKQKMSIDHHIPKMHGGTDFRENLFPAHQICNSIKGDMMPDEFAAHKTELFQHALDTWKLKKSERDIVIRALETMNEK